MSDNNNNVPPKKKQKTVEKKFHCELCGHKSKQKSHLKRHKADVHEIGVTWYHCDHCDYKCKQKSSLNSHKASVHEIGVTWYHCDHCDFKSKKKSNLKRHKANVHEIGVVWHHCDLCDFKCKQKGDLKGHKASVHDIGVTWHHCDLCDFKFKKKSHLKQHKAYVHEIGVVWHHCDLCDFKCKQKGDLKGHKASVHDIGVTWHHCDLCDYKCKKKSNLKQHIKFVENIGDETCDYCGKTNLGVVKPYGFNDKKINMCDDCAIETNMKKRIEHRYTHYLDKHFDFPSRNDTTVKGSACLAYRPDKLYVGITRVLHIEIDEHQHQKKSGDYSCDEKRISDLYDEFQVPVPEHYIVIRLNTDSYHTEKKNYQVDRDKVFNKRAKILLRLMEKIQNNPPASKICIYYLYYSYDSNRISQRYPHILLNDENIEDFLKK